MSQGSGAAHASHSLTRHQSDVIAGVAFIVLALLGPVLGLIFGKSTPNGSLITDAIRAGWYSLPLAIFGGIALSVRIRSPQDYYGGAILAAMAL